MITHEDISSTALDGENQDDDDACPTYLMIVIQKTKRTNGFCDVQCLVLLPQSKYLGFKKILPLKHLNYSLFSFSTVSFISFDLFSFDSVVGKWIILHIVLFVSDYDIDDVWS